MKKYLFIASIAALPVSLVYAQSPKDAYETTVDGVKVIVQPSGNGIVEIQAIIKGGVQNYPADKMGIESLAMTALSECGTMSHDKNSFKDQLDKVNASVYGYSNKNFSVLRMNCIKSDFDTVWPLFTGWASVAEYRAGHPLAGYAHLMQNADLTTAQDLGAVTELLSGAFFQPFGRSTSHQLWSSAMVITPALRGLFGIDVDGISSSIHLDPHLPADWDGASVDRLHVGGSVCSLEYQREGRGLVVKVKTLSGSPVRLVSETKGTRSLADGLSIVFALPPVEVAVPHGLPLPGARTAQMKVLSETLEEHSLKLELEAEAGSVVELRVRRNATKLNLHAEGGTIEGVPVGAEAGLEKLVVKFPAGVGYQGQVVTLRW